MEGIVYTDGIYYGSLVDGKREGKGTMIYNDGSRYTGSWVNDKMQGSGYLFDSFGYELHHAVWYEGQIIYEIDDSWDQNTKPNKHYDRLALLIGNCAYQGGPLSPLNNCISDAEVLSAKLQGLGFDTMVIRDASSEYLKRTIDEFVRKARNSEAAIVFYSGHGASLYGKTYMIPIDATSYPGSTGLYCIDDVVNMLDEVECKIKIEIIDACRNDLAGDEKSFYSRFNDNTKGIYCTNANNVLVAYATSPNYTSSDGICGDHSPYLRALMEVLDKPYIPLSTFFMEVGRLVREYTEGRQQPFVESSIDDINFFLNKG